MLLSNEIIDLKLSQHYQSKTYDVYECYYFEIFQHDKTERIGYIDLRIGESEYLYFLGNIGYRIDLPYRGNGYAYQACQIALPLLKNLGMKKITITCDPDNKPSQKTIMKLKGNYLGNIKIPKDNPLYMQGSRRKLVYQFDLEEMYG